MHINIATVPHNMCVCVMLTVHVCSGALVHNTQVRRNASIYAPHMFVCAWEEDCSCLCVCAGVKGSD